MRLANTNSLRQIEDLGEEIVTVYCNECGSEVGDFFIDDIYEEYCIECMPSPQYKHEDSSFKDYLAYR